MNKKLFEQKIEPNNTQFSIPNFCKMEGTKRIGQKARKLRIGIWQVGHVLSPSRIWPYLHNTKEYWSWHPLAHLTNNNNFPYSLFYLLLFLFTSFCLSISKLCPPISCHFVLMIKVLYPSLKVPYLDLSNRKYNSQIPILKPTTEDIFDKVTFTTW